MLPKPSQANLEAGATNADIQNTKVKNYVGQYPSNVFTVNDEYDYITVLQWMEENPVGFEGLSWINLYLADEHFCNDFLLCALLLTFILFWVRHY